MRIQLNVYNSREALAQQFRPCSITEIAIAISFISKFLPRSVGSWMIRFMLLMSSFPTGISNAFRAGKYLFSGKLFESVQAAQDWHRVNGQKCGKVNVESYFKPKGSLDEEES
ncbi:CLUMA_CG004306, isoform A [Clunio marinus]|uniref:CLUMA_CG004306, isoform A n=1 Tax=Clunio marinus TaxID=568069 RepID=A0A1J1HT99_9DIPT|nr:CLUMA_CG004306, isoform A [Clunio marinus]